MSFSYKLPFGKRFKQLREEKGLTQKEISSLICANSISGSQFISNIERGISYPPKNGLIKICKKYGFNYEELSSIIVAEKTIRILKEWSLK